MDGMDGRGQPAIHSPRRGAGAWLLVVFGAVFPGCSDDLTMHGDSVDAALDGRDADDAADVRRLGDPCAIAVDCDDGVFCNGPEDCFEGRCIGARSTACRDFGGCASARCDEATASCVVDLPATACSMGSKCAPDVGCVKVEGCKDDAACDDGRACTDDRCDVATGSCAHAPVDARCPALGACGIGVCIGELSAEASGCSARPDAARCADDEGCDRSFSCARLRVACVTDLECDDGTDCDGRERCEGARCVHGTITTCVAHDACHHVLCRDRAVGQPFCVETQVAACP